MNKEERYQKFEEECENTGIMTEEYHGRNYYIGPAVECDDFSEVQEVIRATTMELQWDNLGRGYVVYPK